MLKNKEPLNKAALEAFVGNEMARFTNPKDSANFASIRSSLNMGIRTGQNVEAQQIAADTMVRIATLDAEGGNRKDNGMIDSKDFSPAARVNAMVALAELDIGQNKPYSKVTNELYKRAINPNLPSYLRAIALHGVARHAKYLNWPENTKQGVGKGIGAVATSEPSTDLDTQMHSWLVRRAYDVLNVIGSPEAVDVALKRLGDSKELPSLRQASADYLNHIDLSGLPEEKKRDYYLSLLQFVEQSFVNWYESEDDMIKAKSGAGSAGGYGGGMMGGGMMGDSGGMSGYGSDGAGAAMGGYGMGGFGDSSGGESGYGGGQAQRQVRLIETQTWQVRLSRRMLNQITQVAHIAMDGKALEDSKPSGSKLLHLADLGLPTDLEKPTKEFLTALEKLQKNVNDSKVTDVPSLMTTARASIEELMEVVRKTPGFKQKYPHYRDDEELSEGPVVAEKPAGQDPAANPNAGIDDVFDNPAGANPAPKPAGANPAGANPAKPAGANPAAPASPKPAAGANPAGARPVQPAR